MARCAHEPGTSTPREARSIAFALASALCAAFSGLSALAGQPPRLSLPVICEASRPCLIQNYVDLDAGPGVGDFACGSATYDGHKGTDFRLFSAAGVGQQAPVLAAAPGTVKAVRDGMADTFVTAKSKSLIAGRECGNGLVIDHGGGWETQYCHLRRGSLAVRQGDKIERGQRLGDVGYSGLTEFAHLHLEVRNAGQTVDPFTGTGIDTGGGAACSADTEPRPGSLWDETAAAALRYANGNIVSAAFTDAVPKVPAMERDHRLPGLTPASAQLVFVARLLNLRPGDVIAMEVAGPNGFVVTHRSEPLPRAQATYVSYAGKRRTEPSWPPGDYTGSARLLRAGAPVSEMTATVTLSAAK